jgi:hypothetical protein
VLKRVGWAVLLLLALIAANLWDVVSEQSVRVKASRGDPRRQALQCFAQTVFARTKPGESVHFILPSIDADGGLVNHRLRYALPGRYVSTNVDAAPSRRRPDWTAMWQGGCEGVLTR